VSVRVAYMRRVRRGGLLGGLRLVGATGEASWQPRAGSEQEASAFMDAAKWIKQTLEGPRSRDALETLVLDANGAACSWLTCTSTDLSTVGAAARGAGVADDESGGSSTSPVEFFAPSDMDSSVQPLGVEIKPESKHTFLKSRKSKDAPVPQRVAVLATSDVPGRVLVDELDRLGVRVGHVCTIWHAMASAWGTTANSPGNPVKGASSRESVATSSGDAIVGVVLIDPDGQLLWCWAHEGELLASGSMRLRTLRAVTVGGGDEDAAAVIACDAGDVGRLVNEWLGWSMQLSRGPTRVVCVLPESMGDVQPDDSPVMRAGEFGEAFASKWAMASVDAVVHDDPIAATLKRMVNVLEATPASATLQPGQALLTLSNRPNVQTRRLYVWGAAALFAIAGAVGALGWMFQRQAANAEERAMGYRAAWQKPAKDIYPQAFDAGFQKGLSPLAKLTDEVKRREDAMSKPTIASDIKPVMAELEKISLVLSAPNVKVENIVLDSGSVPRVMVVVPTTRDAELLLEGLRRVSGGVLTNWTMSMQDVSGTGERRATFESKWPDDKRAER